MDGPSTSDDAAPKKRKRKYRKSTHAIVKEEKEALKAEIEVLMTRLSELKASTFGTNEEEEEKDRECKDKMVENRVLRRAVRAQQDEFAAVHAFVNDYTFTDTELGSSMHRFIHLKRDESSRRAALVAMKTGAIRRGISLLQRRRPQRHQPWRPLHDDHSFEGSTGDYFVSSFAVMPFQRFKTVREAFRALLVYFDNLEISRTENFGSVTIREDNDNFDSDISQNRLVTTMQSGLRMESNTVFFSTFEEQSIDHNRGRGVVVCDFVDEDDRYPFHPQERTRRDLSSVLEISSYIRHPPTLGGSSDQREEVVVLTRWVHTRLHSPRFELQPEDWGEMAKNTERWMHLLQPSLLETLI